MSDLYRTTEEQKIQLYEIAESMRLYGLDSVFVEKAIKVAEYHEAALKCFVFGLKKQMKMRELLLWMN